MFTGTRSPLFDGDPRPEQVGQGALGDCAKLTQVRGGLRYLIRTRPAAVKDLIWENPDGTVTVALHEVKFYPDGAAIPTGRLFHIRMSKELPVLRSGDQDRSVYAQVRREGVLWPGLVEKALAAVPWTDERAALHAMWHPGEAGLEGYARLGTGATPQEGAEVLAMITGEPAYLIEPRTWPIALATWKDLTEAGKPVSIGVHALKYENTTSSTMERNFLEDHGRNKYETMGPHRYELIGVIHGTADDAARELARFQTGKLHTRPGKTRP